MSRLPSSLRFADLTMERCNDVTNHRIIFTFRRPRPPWHAIVSTRAATLAFLVSAFPIKLPILYANWNDWPRPNGCEYGATLDERWTSMRRVRSQPRNRRRTR